MIVAHVALWTRDLDRAAAFWRSYFDADIGEPYHSQRQEGFVSRFAILPGGSTRIELMTAPWISDDMIRDRIGWAHVAVALGSMSAVDALAARCEAGGCLSSGPRTTGDGFYEAVVTMPDGTPVEITA